MLIFTNEDWVEWVQSVREKRGFGSPSIPQKSSPGGKKLPIIILQKGCISRFGEFFLETPST